MAYNVYQTTYFLPNLNHVALYIETDTATRTGFLFHAKGSIQDGMEFEMRSDHRPGSSKTFLGRQFLGVVKSAANMVKFLEVCESIEVPKKQLDELGRKLFPDEEYRRCQEWVDEAVEALRESGALSLPD
jgi:hypothetical protein